MKTILRPRRHYYLKRVSIFLIAIALVAGIASCAPTPEYNLTMAVAPPGSGTATDLTDASPYAEGTEVSISAVATAGYTFVSWSAPAGTFADANAATTTFTMPARDVTVTANFVVAYDLTMAVAPAGSGTATDLTGVSPYAAGTVVNIQATAAPGYQFAIWTATGGTLADPNAATTTLTMPAQDVTATAHFVGPLDHFKCYAAEDILMEPIDEVVYLEDQFGAFNVTVEWAEVFCNPVEKLHSENVTSISNPDHHLTLYSLDYAGENVTRSVEVSNQFGTEQLTVVGPVALGVPTQKVEPGDHDPPVGLDHYLLYEVIEGPPVVEPVGLKDQFGDEPEVVVTAPVLFANPVRKTHGENVTEIWDPEAHLVFYEILLGEVSPPQVQVVNQFGEQTIDVYDPDLLAVPSEKLEPPPLDHFKCYDVEGAVPVYEQVELQDQFSYFNSVLVRDADWFCNPVEKNSEPIVNPDNHLTVYDISAPQTTWSVIVDNQFGVQQLTVSGPIALAVPTWKRMPGSHQPPEYLDHFLLYEVTEGQGGGVQVDLDDQFPESAPHVSVMYPVYFANPVLQKIHGEDVTGVWNPEAHLVFYRISPNIEFYTTVRVYNQFEQNPLHDLINSYQLLAAPSAKLYYEQIP